MAGVLTFAAARRALAQRMGFWAGNISNNGTATFSTVNSTTDVVDVNNRTEADGIFNNAWLVINPGTASASWAKIANYTQANAEITLLNPLGSLPVANTTPYEIYQVGKPEQWLQALNWAILLSYPQRHTAVDFEIQEDPETRIYDYRQLAEGMSIADPTSTSPVISAIANPASNYVAGTYTVGYCWVGPYGKTLLSQTANVTISAGQGIHINQLSAPDGAIGIEYYFSVEPGSTTVSSVPSTDFQLAAGVDGSVYGPCRQRNGIVPAVDSIIQPNLIGNAAPLYNTTQSDMQELYQIHRRVNPDAGPEIWTDLGPSGWQPLGGTKIQLFYRPVSQYRLRFIGSAPLPSFVQETDSNNEPVELILAGAEYYMWNLLSKTANIQGVNWEKLAAASLKEFEEMKGKYAQDQPRQTVRRPGIGIAW